MNVNTNTLNEGRATTELGVAYHRRYPPPVGFSPYAASPTTVRCARSAARNVQPVGYELRCTAVVLSHVCVYVRIRQWCRRGGNDGHGGGDDDAGDGSEGGSDWTEDERRTNERV